MRSYTYRHTQCRCWPLTHCRYEALCRGELPEGYRKQPTWARLNALKNVCHKVTEAEHHHQFLECTANPYRLVCRGCRTFSHDGMCPHVMAVTHVMEQEKEEGERDPALDLFKLMRSLDRVRAAAPVQTQGEGYIHKGAPKRYRRRKGRTGPLEARGASSGLGKAQSRGVQKNKKSVASKSPPSRSVPAPKQITAASSAQKSTPTSVESLVPTLESRRAPSSRRDLGVNQLERLPPPLPTPRLPPSVRTPDETTKTRAERTKARAERTQSPKPRAERTQSPVSPLAELRPLSTSGMGLTKQQKGVGGKRERKRKKQLRFAEIHRVNLQEKLECVSSSCAITGVAGLAEFVANWQQLDKEQEGEARTGLEGPKKAPVTSSAANKLQSVPSMVDINGSPLSDYEVDRLKNIEKNQQILESLGLGGGVGREQGTQSGRGRGRGRGRGKAGRGKTGKGRGKGISK